MRKEPGEREEKPYDDCVNFGRIFESRFLSGFQDRGFLEAACHAGFVAVDLEARSTSGFQPSPHPG